MSLFDIEFDSHKNLLPFDGMVNYYGMVFAIPEADQFHQALLNNIDWQQDEIFMFGRKIITKRKVAWYGDQPYDYTYSKSTKKALLWTNDLLMIKEKIEELSNESYNSCLLNLYHTGEEGMSWHSDDEPELKKEGAIASVSFGAERKFSFKHRKSGEKVDLLLEHGSLLVMKGSTQSHWLHRLNISKKIIHPRINLTFRTIN